MQTRLSSRKSASRSRLRCYVLLRRMLYPLMLACLLAMPLPASSAERVALVLAAEDYVGLKRSEISVEQSREIAEELRARDFDVLIAPNPTNGLARAKLYEFARKVEGAKIAIAILVGHLATTRGHTFFLPINANIRRITDLLSRSIAISSVARITARARSGAVLFLMTAADLPSKFQGVEERPSMSIKPAENVVVVFSSSGKVPVSRIGAVTKQATLDLVAAVRKTPLKLAALVDAAAARGKGLVIGMAPDVDLSTSPTEETEISEAELSKVNAELRARLEAEGEARLKAELKARRQAEFRIREAEERVRQAEERVRQAEMRARQAQERTRREEARRALEASTRSALGAADVVGNVPSEDPDGVDASSQALGTDIAPLQDFKTASIGLKPKAEETNSAEQTPLDPRELALALQTELKRVGCLTGKVDGKWGPVSHGALRRFDIHTSESLGSSKPTAQSLSRVQAALGRVCPIVCGAGQTSKGDRCLQTAKRRSTSKPKNRVNTNHTRKAKTTRRAAKRYRKPAKARLPKRREDNSGLQRQCENHQIRVWSACQ